MNHGMSDLTALHILGIAIAKGTALLSAITWILLVLLSGSLVPRATLVAAVLATALALAAYRAVQTGQLWVLLVAATFGALTPPDIGSAPIFFRYIGVLAIGYAISALFLGATWKHHRRAS